VCDVAGSLGVQVFGVLGIFGDSGLEDPCLGLVFQGLRFEVKGSGPMQYHLHPLIVANLHFWRLKDILEFRREAGR